MESKSLIAHPLIPYHGTGFMILPYSDDGEPHADLDVPPNPCCPCSTWAGRPAVAGAQGARFAADVQAAAETGRTWPTAWRRPVISAVWMLPGSGLSMSRPSSFPGGKTPACAQGLGTLSASRYKLLHSARKYDSPSSPTASTARNQRRCVEVLGGDSSSHSSSVKLAAMHRVLREFTDYS